MSESEKRKRVVWNEGEWHQVYDEVLRRRVQEAAANGVEPIALSISAEEPDGILTPIEVHKAAANVMTGERARNIATTKGLYSPQMMEAFASWHHKQRMAVTPAVMSARQVERVPDDGDEADLEQNTHSYRTTARAEEDNRPAKRERERHEWNDDQWQAICDLLMKRMPITMNSSTLVGVKLKDIESAARALWEDEPIPTFQMTQARARLLECVVRAKAQPAEVQPADSPVQALMKAFVEELVKGLAPTLAQMEARIVDRMRGEVSNAVKEMHAAFPGDRRDPTTRLPKVAIVGGYNKPHQLEQTLKEKFPQYRFIMLGRDPRNFADTVRQCTIVLCNVEGISHATARAVKSAAQENAFHQVNGGETHVVRCLDIISKTI